MFCEMKTMSKRYINSPPSDGYGQNEEYKRVLMTKSPPFYVITGWNTCNCTRTCECHVISPHGTPVCVFY